MKFEDIELNYKDETHTVPANKVMKLYRGVAGLAKWEYFAESASILGDSPWLFSDAYCKALSFAGCEAESDEVLEWMVTGNYADVLDALVKIKTLFNPPEEIQKKVGKSKDTKKKKVKK
tara:strand:+ start:1088 stop:1444 length:357 start_codon:yes stop_codon:yes gene_type:complete